MEHLESHAKLSEHSKGNWQLLKYPRLGICPDMHLTFSEIISCLVSHDFYLVRKLLCFSNVLKKQKNEQKTILRRQMKNLYSGMQKECGKADGFETHFCT